MRILILTTGLLLSLAAMLLESSWTTFAGERNLRTGDAKVAPASSFREVRAFRVPEAHQGVAVDRNYFYPITNRAVAKYDKRTGKLVQRWDSTKEVSLKHLNSGVVVGGKLYAAHSTWPSKPPKNSIEIWDTKTMTHIGRKMLDEDKLALTWADRHAGAWWVVFAAYGDAASVARTKLVKFDDDWKPLATWHFPRQVIDRFVPYSNSGGSIGPDGLIYTTGHDRSEVYVLQVPDTGATLKHVRTLPLAVYGQAIAWDRAQPGMLYGIRRKTKEVVVSQLIGVPDPEEASKPLRDANCDMKRDSAERQRSDT